MARTKGNGSKTENEQPDEAGEEKPEFTSVKLGRQRAQEFLDLLVERGARGGTIEHGPDRLGVVLTTAIEKGKRIAPDAKLAFELTIEGKAPEPLYRYSRKDEYKEVLASGTTIDELRAAIEKTYIAALIEAQRLGFVHELRQLMEFDVEVGKDPRIMKHIEEVAIKRNLPVAYQLMTIEHAIYLIDMFTWIKKHGLDGVDSVLQDADAASPAVEAE